MLNFADDIRSYAQEWAEFACSWALREEAAGDFFWENMTGPARVRADLTTRQLQLIVQAIALGTVAGRPTMDPLAVRHCRDILLELQAASQKLELAMLLEECFDIGYRVASTR
jgi:hypothetical protein